MRYDITCLLSQPLKPVVTSSALWYNVYIMGCPHPLSQGSSDFLLADHTPERVSLCRQHCNGGGKKKPCICFFFRDDNVLCQQDCAKPRSTLWLLLTYRAYKQPPVKTLKKKKNRKRWKNYSTEYSHVVPHHSTDSAIKCLTAQIGRDAVVLLVYGRNSKVWVPGWIMTMSAAPWAYFLSVIVVRMWCPGFESHPGLFFLVP